MDSRHNIFATTVLGVLAIVGLLTVVMLTNCQIEHGYDSTTTRSNAQILQFGNENLDNSTTKGVCQNQTSINDQRQPQNQTNTHNQTHLPSVAQVELVNQPCLKFDVRHVGFGSNLNTLAILALRAQYEQKQIMINDHNFIYKCRDVNSWGCYFEYFPASGCDNNRTERTDLHELIDWWVEFQGSPTHMLCLATILKIDATNKTELPHLMTREAFKREFDFNSELKQIFQEAENSLRLGNASIAVHIRRGDADQINIRQTQDYVDVIDNQFSEFHSLFVMSDDYRAIEEFQALRPSWNISSLTTRDNTGFHNMRSAQDYNTRRESAIGFLVDVHIATRCDYFISKCSSNVARLIQLLRDKPLVSSACLEEQQYAVAGCPTGTCIRG